MPGRYASITTREKLAGPVNEMEQIKSDPYLYRSIPQKEKFEADYARRKENLDKVTPPDTTGSEKDKIKTREQQLAEALIRGNPDYVPPMPEDDQMQRPRAGSVDQHMRWENFWKKHTLDTEGKIVRVNPRDGGRGAVYEWKDLRRILHKGFEEEMPNAANIDMIRPHGRPVLADTHLPVSYGLSYSAKRNYDEVFPDHEPTPVEQKIEEAQVERLDAAVQKIVNDEQPKVVKSSKKKRNVSPAARDAARQRMNAYWAAKKAQKE